MMATVGNVGENILIVFWMLVYVNRHSVVSYMGILYFPESSPSFIYQGNRKGAVHVSHKQLSGASDGCLLILFTSWGKKNESLRRKSTDLHPSCFVQAWAAGWESTEQCFGPVPGSSQLCCPARDDLGWAVPPFPCAWKVSLSWSCWFFVSFFQSILTPAAEKSQTLLSMIYPGAWDKSRLPGRNRLPSLESMVLLEVHDCLKCLHPGLLK